MEKYFRTFLLLLFFVLVSGTVHAASDMEELPTQTQYDWSNVIDAIIHVESGGRPDAKSGSSVGVMQITPIMVMECNNILRARKSKRRYKLSDRKSVKKSKEMFLIFQSWYNPRNSVEWAIRSWNGGLKYSVRQTQRYFDKVMAALR